MKAGIAVDNYKINKFKKELNKNGFTDYEVFPFTKDTSTIKVEVEKENLAEIKKLCIEIELHFKRSNWYL
jgi:hypothetical protein